MRYKVAKEKINKKEIDYIKIIFDNGDCFAISKNEIEDISLRLYDKLVLRNVYCSTFCAVIESGYLKLKPSKRPKKYLEYYTYLHNFQEFKQDRVSYIKKRLCEEGGVSTIEVNVLRGTNENVTEDVFVFNCQAETIAEGELLVMKFMKSGDGGYESDFHYIMLPDIYEGMVDNIKMDMENCESFYVFENEIVQMQLDFDEELDTGPYGYCRKIASGFLKIELDETIGIAQRSDSRFFTYESSGNGELVDRLCGKNGYGLHDICYLYISFKYFSPVNKEECIAVSDIRSEEELAEIERLEAEELHEVSPYFLGGYAKRIDKNTVLITFGDAALKDKRCQKKLIEYSVLNSDN